MTGVHERGPVSGSCPRLRDPLEPFLRRPHMPDPGEGEMVPQDAGPVVGGALEDLLPGRSGQLRVRVEGGGPLRVGEHQYVVVDRIRDVEEAFLAGDNLHGDVARRVSRSPHDLDASMEDRLPRRHGMEPVFDRGEVFPGVLDEYFLVSSGIRSFETSGSGPVQ